MLFVSEFVLLHGRLSSSCLAFALGNTFVVPAIGTAIFSVFASVSVKRKTFFFEERFQKTSVSICVHDPVPCELTKGQDCKSVLCY